jgi:hypothetical protein
MKQALAQATAKAKQQEEAGSDEDDDEGVAPGRSAGGPGGMPDMSALAAMMGGLGGVDEQPGCYADVSTIL